MASDPIQEADARKYQRIGRYELLGEIASGGMATVFLGRAIGVKGFSRLVAIKKLHPHLEREEDFVAAFLDEARLAARIRHPNVVPTLDVDDRDGLYIVMEYVEGDRLLGLLRHAVKNGEPLPIPIALKIAVETLYGLHAAHELTDDDGALLNLVHRDVSPQNVLIGIDGVTKITDFGIAKAESRLVTTRDGQLKGKIAYMAPEQARGGGVDRRVDVFAMGILVWEMLTSRRLFKGENDVEVLSAVLTNVIPTTQSVMPSVPDEVDAVVMRALARDPGDRYDTALEFAEAIEHVALGLGGLASTRVVASHVQRVAGPKLQAERERIKAGVHIAGLKESPSSPSRPFGNKRSGISRREDEDNSLPASPVALEEEVVSSNPRRTLTVAAVAVIVALSVALGVMIVRRPTSPTGSPATVETHAAAVPVPAPAPAPEVHPAAPPAIDTTAATGTPVANTAPGTPANPPSTPTTAAATNTAPPATTTRTARRPAPTHGGNAGHAGSHNNAGSAGDDGIDSISVNPYRH